MSKEVLIVTETMGIDGPERVISELVKQWSREGYDITVVLTRAATRKSTYPLPDSVRTIIVDAHEKGGKLARLDEIRQVRSILRMRPKAVAVSLMISTSFSLAMASIGLKNRIVLSERNDPGKVPFTALQRKLRDLSFEIADRIVFQTQDAMNYFPPRIQRKGTIIFNPVNPDLPERHMGSRRKVLVAAGRLAPQKNFPMLIRAFARVSKECPDYRLDIFGEGADRESLQQLIDQNGLTDRIRMPGFSRNVYAEMVDCAAYISSSDYEGMSNSMLEALAMGVPVICTDCPIGGAKTVIEHEKNGLLVPVGDEEKMYQAITRVIKGPAFADRMSQNAYAIRNRLNIHDIAHQWSELL